MTSSPLQDEHTASSLLPDSDWNVLIVGSSEIAEIESEATRVESILNRLGHRTSRRIAPRTDWEERIHPAKEDRYDLVVVLGGDGSILRTAHWMGYAQSPVLGINLGRLGFLAGVSSNDVDTALANLARGRFCCVDHLMLECEIIRQGHVLQKVLGLNEASILAGPPFSMIEIALHIDGELATTYHADGLIVSTPVGSTAHNLSAGGPIVRKDLDAFIFTPLSPHTLSNRPVIDSATREYELVFPSPNSGSACVVDGRMISNLVPDDRVRVRRASPRFTLIEMQELAYYRTLREKLFWGGKTRVAGPHGEQET